MPLDINYCKQTLQANGVVVEDVTKLVRAFMAALAVLYIRDTGSIDRYPASVELNVWKSITYLVVTSMNDLVKKLDIKDPTEITPIVAYEYYEKEAPEVLPDNYKATMGLYLSVPMHYNGVDYTGAEDNISFIVQHPE